MGLKIQIGERYLITIIIYSVAREGEKEEGRGIGKIKIKVFFIIT